METQAKLTRQRNQILAQLATLGPMRKGSLSQQYVQTVLKDGAKSQRGPYTVYTCKENGKTLSRRLTRQDEVALYREQIATFRRFQELTADLARIGQQLADCEITGDEGSKKNSRN
jgi:hypothetical protein